jgi:hypothetical protein
MNFRPKQKKSDTKSSFLDITAWDKNHLTLLSLEARSPFQSFKELASEKFMHAINKHYFWVFAQK